MFKDFKHESADMSSRLDLGRVQKNEGCQEMLSKKVIVTISRHELCELPRVRHFCS